MSASVQAQGFAACSLHRSPPRDDRKPCRHCRHRSATGIWPTATPLACRTARWKKESSCWSSTPTYPFTLRTNARCQAGSCISMSCTLLACSPAMTSQYDGIRNVERQDAPAAAFACDRDACQRGPLKVLEGQADQLRHPHAGNVGQCQHRPISGARSPVAGFPHPSASVASARLIYERP